MSSSGASIPVPPPPSWAEAMIGYPRTGTHNWPLTTVLGRLEGVMDKLRRGPVDSAALLLVSKWLGDYKGKTASFSDPERERISALACETWRMMYGEKKGARSGISVFSGSDVVPIMDIGAEYWEAAHPIANNPGMRRALPPLDAALTGGGGNKSALSEVVGIEGAIHRMSAMVGEDLSQRFSALLPARPYNQPAYVPGTPGSAYGIIFYEGAGNRNCNLFYVDEKSGLLIVVEAKGGSGKFTERQPHADTVAALGITGKVSQKDIAYVHTIASEMADPSPTDPHASAKEEVGLLMLGALANDNLLYRGICTTYGKTPLSPANVKVKTKFTHPP